MDIFRTIELDRSLAKAIGLTLTTFPVRERAAFTIVDGDGRVSLAALATELDALVTREPEMGDVYGHSISRMALIASRQADRDGGIERALTYALIAARHTPQDAEIIANLAIALFTNGRYDDAVDLFDTVLTNDGDGAWVGLRILAARNALLAARREAGLAALEPLPADSPSVPDFAALRERLQTLATG